MEQQRLAIVGVWLLGLVYAVWSAWPVIGPVVPRDFTIFWLAGKLALAGHPEIAYNREAFAAFAQATVGMERAVSPYPPHMFLLFAPLALLKLEAAFLLWNALCFALFAWAARPYMKGIPLPLAALTPAACVSLALGQTGLLIGALWLLAFRKRSWAVGLLTLKPHLGLLAAFTLRQPRAFIIAAVTVAGALVIAAILFPNAFTAFPQAIFRQGAYLQSADYRIWYFQSVSPRFGYGIVGWLLFATAALFLLARRFDPFTAAAASVLISPYAFHYDLTVACLGFGLAMLRDRRPHILFLLMFGFFTPYLVLVGTTWLAPPLILGALYALTVVDPDPLW